MSKPVCPSRNTVYREQLILYSFTAVSMDTFAGNSLAVFNCVEMTEN